MLYRALSGPITCQIELTSACNNDCLYCYNHWRHDKEIPGASMSRDLLNATIEQLVASNVFQVTFTGGETLLRKEELFWGLRRFFQHDVSCGVNSNLTRMTVEDARTLYAIGLRGVLASVCSFDAETHDHISQRQGAFAQTMQGIKNAQAGGLGVAASMVLTKLNVHQVLETGIALKSMGVDQFYATKASPPVNAKDFKRLMISPEELAQVLEDMVVLKQQHGVNVGVLECYPLCSYEDSTRYSFLKGRRCSAGLTTCTVGANGDIRPCSHSDTSYGNILDGGLQAAWDAMTDQRDGSLLPLTCKQCAFLSHCSGGCRVDAFCCNGRYDSCDPYARPDRLPFMEAPVSDVEPVSSEERLVVNNDLHVRREEGGVFCASRTMMGSPTFVTQDTFDLIQALVQEERFSAQDVADRSGLAEEDARTLCGMLKQEQIFLAFDTPIPE